MATEPKTQNNRTVTDMFIIYKNLVEKRLVSCHLTVKKKKPIFLIL